MNQRCFSTRNSNGLCLCLSNDLGGDLYLLSIWYKPNTISFTIPQQG